MTLRSNTAEGGSDATSVTTGNSGGGSGDAFGTVSAGAGGTITFSAAAAMHGALGYRFTSASPICFTVLDDGSSGTAFSVSFSLRISGAPASETIFPMEIQGAAGGTVVQFHLNTARQLRVVDALNVGTNFTTALALNTAYRVSLTGTVGTSVTVTAKLYLLDGTTPIETLTPTCNTGATNSGRVVWGKFTAVTMAAFDLDDILQDCQSSAELGVPTVTTIPVFLRPTQAARLISR